ncbi:hypothetical protein [Enterococcus sp. HY326]|uniref:hypothetical protein n=1 Tax=Enterococcus sp. HY326 TaxID=2971265 RepID=UPI00223E932B|nr:hypothetical protein [Enterococcus sp. HY326]
MELSFKKAGKESQLIYGETLAASLADLDYADKHVVIITNQRYYDLFSMKMTQLLAAADDIDWYICPNHRNCNSLKELTSLLEFVGRFKRQDFLFIAFGNEGVVELTNYLQKNTLLDSRFWVLPISLRSLAKGLLGSGQILDSKQQPILQSQNLPELIFFDQTLTQEQTAGKLLDLLVFIKCGLLVDRNFLKELFFNYPQEKSVLSKPLSGMLVNLVAYYEKNGAALDEYGQVFKRAFYMVEAGQLLSDSMKEFLGILFHLLWNINQKQLNFNYLNFLQWLKRLDYPLELPTNFLIGDYAAAVLKVLEKSESLLTLAKIGTIEGREIPSSQELITMLEDYQGYLQE